MYFRRKHVETGPNRSHELATFLKYYIPFRLIVGILKKLVGPFQHLKKKENKHE